MQIIRELEPDARGLYTGAIGWFEPPAARRSIGDFCMSVPIRTVVLEPPGDDGRRRGELGIGAGIVHDSVAPDEYEECHLKGRFLTGLAADFELFETMRATREHGCRRERKHLQRMRESAEYFGFRFDENALRESLRQACAALPAERVFRLRLALDANGTSRIDCAPLAPLSEPVRLLVSEQPTRADDFFLRHKTSMRARYDAAWRHAEAHGAFDSLFFNTEGELTEGARSNVFVRHGARWLTPPLAAGVLPGVMRAEILCDPHWNARETWLSLGDLLSADEIVVCNSLRGVLRARLDFVRDARP
jgi:para-aminobenzoate synthetase/4-amino-4-deoxychorismate lyase